MENAELLTNFLTNVLSFNPDSPMLFTQFNFWVFFAIVFCAFALFKNIALLRNTYLLFVSLFFYYKTSGWFVGLLILITISDFLIARRIDHHTNTLIRKLWLALSILIDLGILCYFKYAYFLVDFINQVAGTDFAVSNWAAEFGNRCIGSPVFSIDQIILPVGVSFYTFQVISYTVDVYRRQIKPVTNILDFGFYVSFFPQLVAGPIIKATDFIPQLYHKYHVSRRMFGIAIFWILNGMAKKIILSDYLAINFIDRVFDNPLLFTGFENLMALFVYSMQVYADFSGYTDIAIGLSLLMGFHLPANFNSPYKSPNCHNFWKRWHISLSRWLQYYLYIPLGGNRGVTFATWVFLTIITVSIVALTGSVWIAAAVLAIAIATIIYARFHPDSHKAIYANMNSIITMLLGGLWHGASMNFMVWGGMNGAGMIVFKFWRDFKLTTRLAVIYLLTAALAGAHLYFHTGLTIILVWFAASVCVATTVQAAWRLAHADRRLGTNLISSATAHAWAVLFTFVFISFTRLFFRSGSNLDPAIANEAAWSTATQMVHQMGTAWNTNIIPILTAYWKVFTLFGLGMLIHWIPARLKARYRFAFSALPLPVMAAAFILVIFIVWQFASAEMQPFIYFQF
ncbi:MAG: MBOAT family protein [Bacteroidaceae bacterium]|nr:MBOAT family protein [Bacteroidaceae bacterium]